MLEGLNPGLQLHSGYQSIQICNPTKLYNDDMPLSMESRYVLGLSETLSICHYLLPH